MNSAGSAYLEPCMWVYPAHTDISCPLKSFSLSLPGVVEGTFQPEQAGGSLGVTLPLPKSLTAGTEAVSQQPGRDVRKERNSQ